MSESTELELQEKRVRLVNGISKSTHEGRISWDDTSEEDTFVTQIKDLSIQVVDDSIRASAEPSRHGTCHIFIFNSHGNVIDRFEVRMNPYDFDESPLSISIIGLRQSLNDSLAKLTSTRLDAVLEAIGV